MLIDNKHIEKMMNDNIPYQYAQSQIKNMSIEPLQNLTQQTEWEY